MKLTKYFLSSLFVVFVITGFKPDRGIRDLIEWNQGLKVNWNDYKGPIADTTKIASSDCGIYCIPQVLGDTGVVTLVAYFDRNKSWVCRHHADAFLLQHEQGHFDLTEAYARKLRKKVASLKLNRENFSSEIQKFYNWAWEDLQKQQAAYDKATDHGAVDFAQHTWDKYIKEHLELYKDYFSPTVRFEIQN